MTIADQITSFSGNVSGAGTVVFSNSANNYAGFTWSLQGNIQNGASNVIPDGVAFGMAAGSTWDLNHYYEAIAGFGDGSTGTVKLNGGTLRIIGNGWVSNNTTITDGTTTGGVLVKDGGNSITLGHAMSYTGATIVTSNTLSAERGEPEHLVPRQRRHVCHGQYERGFRHQHHQRHAQP